MRRLAKVHAIVYEEEESKFKFIKSLNKLINKVLKENPDIKIIHFNDGLIAAFCLFFTSLNHVKRTVTLHGLDVVFPSSIYQKLIFPLFNKFDLIIAVSTATANACDLRGISREKIVTINNWVDIRPMIRMNRNKVEKVLFLIVGTVKRKGFSGFIEKVMPKLHNYFALGFIVPISKPTNSLRQFIILPSFIKRKMELLLGFPSDE